MRRAALLATLIAAEAAIGSGFQAAIGSGFQAALGPRPSALVVPRRLCARTQRRRECVAQAGSTVLADGKEAGASASRGAAPAIDVVVLGGGPVGLATCVGLLGMDATRKVTVVERGPRDLAKDGPFSNMIGLGDRCVSMQRRGLWGCASCPCQHHEWCVCVCVCVCVCARVCRACGLQRRARLV